MNFKPRAATLVLLWILASIGSIFILLAAASAAEARSRHYQKQIYQQVGFDWGQQWQQPRQYKKTIKRKRIAKRHKRTIDANGNIASGAGIVRAKTGATARVSAAFAAKFQAYIDDLESAGATVRFMGGIRRGRCSSGHMHPCGKAIDVCQLSRGRVDSSCHLPHRIAIAEIAARHGLFEGGQWCNQDYGHAQVGVSAPACGTQVASARRHYRHHRYRVARR